MIPPPESSIKKEEEKDHGAALLPADPSASQSTTEALPTSEEQCQEALGMCGATYRCCLREGHQGNVHAHSYGIMWSTPQFGSGNQRTPENSASTRRSEAQKSSVTDQAEGAEGR